jgi:ParB/RepB/Spo0J family partition protein
MGMKAVELPLDSLDLRYARLRRRHPQAERRLLASLEEIGQQSPVIVVAGAEPGRYVLIEGRKRVRALRRLKADVVKAAIWEMTAGQALVAAYQLQDGTGWNALEEGWLVWELVRGAGLSTAEAGLRLERSKAWVSGRLGLVESLPEAVQEGVRSGKIGAYTATRHLLAFARANAEDCERLATKVIENGFRSREVETLCRYYASAGREGKRRMLEDPGRFLKALEASKHKDGGSGSVEEARCLKNLELIGNVSLGLARSLPAAVAGDTATAARERLKPAWERARRRWTELVKTASLIFEPAAGAIMAGTEAADA